MFKVLKLKNRIGPELLIPLCILLFLLSLVITLFVGSTDREVRKDYTYMKVKTAGNLQLHIIKTSPWNIGLKAIDTNVTKTQDFGINGGFFWQGYLLSVAVMNDIPVKFKPDDYGSGWFNIDRKRGTLVWDGDARRFSVQVVETAKELVVQNRSNYWAQGGVSMGYQNETGWTAQASAEEMPVMEEPRMRSGMVFDKNNEVWLIVTPTLSTVEQFRNAVRDTVGKELIVDGIFLDGDGSSQLKLPNAMLAGDHRQVYQMITLLSEEAKEKE